MDHYRTEAQIEANLNRFALRLAEIVQRRGHNPHGADIEAMIERAKALAEREAA